MTIRRRIKANIKLASTGALYKLLDLPLAILLTILTTSYLLPAAYFLLGAATAYQLLREFS